MPGLQRPIIVSFARPFRLAAANFLRKLNVPAPEPAFSRGCLT